ncbi:prepilin peptidase [Staphylococcus simiae]|uniref:prepilin peptidase n=1 Tax=Staphylococcus simiae TaxID=308354 RepID=UPI001A99D4C6|nr:prepilin peptidase [Staphylococcus simiae]MBO1203924.1 prepilin peptidase [Staphylococcus simiae]MBO1230156.1 prepilin peptidase [Staphylococcus simiae]
MLVLTYCYSCLYSFLSQISSVKTLNFKACLIRSKCDACHHQLAWFELFPIFSYILLKTKCRYCQQKIPLTHFVGEVLAICPFFLIYFSVTNIHSQLLISTFLFFLVLSINDIDSMTIDLRILIIYVIVTSTFTHIYIISFFIVTLSAHLFYIVYRTSIGYGDILVISVLSLFFPLSFLNILLIMTFLLAGMVALCILIFRRIIALPLVAFILNSIFYDNLFRFLGGYYI